MEKGIIAVKFTLKNGKYITDIGEEITTKMLLKNNHWIQDKKGEIFLPPEEIKENLCLTCHNTQFCQSKGIYLSYICGDHPQHID